MSFSRWKMMAGVLGVSIGGLAAAASQCPKLDMSKGRSSEPPVAKADPKLPPAGAPTAPAFPDVPAAPSLVPAGVTPPAPSAPMLPLPAPDNTAKVPAPTNSALPPLPADFPPTLDKAEKPTTKHPEVTTTGATLPSIPGTPSAPTSSKTSDTKSSVPLPPPAAAPTPGDLIPAPPMPSKPPQAKSEPLPPSTDLFVTLPEGASTAPQKPTPSPAVKQPVPLPPAANHEKPLLITPVVGSGAANPPSAGGTLPPQPPVGSGPGSVDPLVNDVPQSKPTFAPPASAPVAAVAEPKFRIILRVGEGEPTFEVKNGDNLVLKVACEKVDIESVEKGTGLSKVTARGKVRFVGFGAEGSCESLSFIAGTGEVQMNGEVKVQVKDKLGRVESELTTAAMKYKIDASSVGGTLKP
ncbi:hypothetical protein [Frigoriglobus tundricola]|uniref:Uncharacterized protein n=1 Tax=Frigoriglobus tundricola TaxID=2774151 RepID=A0A6M5YUA7_9BACT|nr:hypothetical protein [Frigoriglobus tundricola]QJW96893.1 hypothetical protein FTUN_4453 [Frigoriglobus tundricola]